MASDSGKTVLEPSITTGSDAGLSLQPATERDDAQDGGDDDVRESCARG